MSKSKKARIEEALATLSQLFLLGLDTARYSQWMQAIKETGDLDALAGGVTLIMKLAADFLRARRTRTTTPDQLALYVLLARILYESGAKSLDEDVPGRSWRWPVAHWMAEEGYIFTDPRILRIKDEYGRSVAFKMAEKGHIFTDPEILRFGRDGFGIAIQIHLHGHTFNNTKIYGLRNITGETVAHWAVKRGHVFDEKTQKPILRLRDGDGFTVAHEMANRRHVFTDPKILKFRDGDGNTVAHIMAYNGHVFDEKRQKSILRLAEDREGWTVAHEMVGHGHRFTAPAILRLATKDGLTVKMAMGPPPEPE